jgi:membrane-bound lytic murein transglycosylase MltF
MSKVWGSFNIGASAAGVGSIAIFHPETGVGFDITLQNWGVSLPDDDTLKAIMEDFISTLESTGKYQMANAAIFTTVLLTEEESAPE